MILIQTWLLGCLISGVIFLEIFLLKPRYTSDHTWSLSCLIQCQTCHINCSLFRVHLIILSLTDIILLLHLFLKIFSILVPHFVTQLLANLLLLVISLHTLVQITPILEVVIFLMFRLVVPILHLLLQSVISVLFLHVMLPLPITFMIQCGNVPLFKLFEHTLLSI